MPDKDPRIEKLIHMGLTEEQAEQELAKAASGDGEDAKEKSSLFSGEVVIPEAATPPPISAPEIALFKEDQRQHRKKTWIRRKDLDWTTEVMQEVLVSGKDRSCLFDGERSHKDADLMRQKFYFARSRHRQLYPTDPTEAGYYDTLSFCINAIGDSHELRISIDDKRIPAAFLTDEEWEGLANG